MTRKKSKSASKRAVTKKVKNKVVNRSTRSKNESINSEIQNLINKTNSKGFQQYNTLKKPLKRLKSLKKFPKLNKFQCRVCRLDFLNQLSFRNHKKRFRRANYSCIECDTEFTDREQLGIHFEHTHTGVSIPGYPHKCHVCGQVFMHKAFLHAHLCHNHKQNWHATNILSISNGKITWDKTEWGEIIENSVRSLEKVTSEKFNQIGSNVSFENYGCMESEMAIVKKEVGAQEITIRHKRHTNSLELKNKNRILNKSDADLRTQYACKPCYVLVQKLSLNTIPVFVCKLCNVIFPSEELKKNHITGAHTFVESTICDKRLPTESWMRRHFRDEHSIGCDENETCVCGKNMHVPATLEEHFFQHSMRTYISALKPLTVAYKCRPSEKTEVCNNCGKTFWLKTCLEIHNRDCSQVIADSSDPMTLQVNSKRRIGQETIDFNEVFCRVCCAQFSTRIALLNHIRFYARTKRYRCHICGASFNGKSLLKTHTRDAHTFHTAYYYSCYCIICDQGFAKKIYRRIHIAHVHGEKYPIKMTSKPTIESRCNYDKRLEHDDNDRKCLICNLQFVSRKLFIEHINYFKTEETIVCGICSQSLQGQYNAHRHYKMCHYPADIREVYQHKCPICKEAFAFKLHLKSHGKHVHGKNIHGINLMRKQNNEKIGDCSATLSTLGVVRYHMCAICEVSFPNLDFLTAHQMEYEMNGKFVCPRCGRRCGTSTSLLDHLSLNHSTAIHDSIKCRRCDEYFLTPAIWVSHMKHCHMTDAIQLPETFLESHINFLNKFQVTELKSLPVCKQISNVAMSTQAAHQSNRNSTKKKLVNSKQHECETAELLSENDVEKQIVIDITEEIGIERGQMICSSNILSTEKKWHCRICGIDCLGADGLAKHNARYANEGRYKCEICARRFKSMKACQEHVLIHRCRKIKNVYQCEVCHESVGNPTALKSHNAHFHDGKTRTLEAVSPRFDKASNSQISICSSQSNSMMPCYNGSSCAGKCSILENQFVQLNPNDESAALDILDSKLLANDVKNCPTSKSSVTNVEGETLSDQIPMCVTGVNSLTPSSVSVPEKKAETSVVQSTNKYFIRQSLFQCEVCSSIFNTKCLLESHRTNIHKIAAEATEKNLLVVLTEITGMDIMNSATIGHLIPLPKESLSRKDYSTFSEDPSKSETRLRDCSSGGSPLRCEPCDFVFPTSQMLQLHNNWVHSGSFPNIECTDVSNLNSPAPMPSTVQDSARHSSLFVDDLSMVSGPQALGVNVEQQQSNIIIQTVSIPIAISGANMIMHVTGEQTSCVQNKIESSINSDACNSNSLKRSTRSFTKTMDTSKNRSAMKRNESSANACKGVLKKIKQEPND
ncbi:zinc finger protein 808-like [Venturia canescens]|uniref:zinc finger protein 808-like n=1 Tax=Venturia canescens TaxID=32260 RepID=UPI001C9C31D6|nr:zinc finger protein 808-like [Venturia canescens]